MRHVRRVAGFEESNVSVGGTADHPGIGAIAFSCVRRSVGLGLVEFTYRPLIYFVARLWSPGVGGSECMICHQFLDKNSSRIEAGVCMMSYKYV